jgi:hypothetical protein
VCGIAAAAAALIALTMLGRRRNQDVFTEPDADERP